MLLCAPSSVLAQNVVLGTAANFGVLGATPDVTNTGPTVVTGNVGVWPAASVTGFPPGIVNGTIHLGDAVAQQGQADLTTAYNDAAGRPCPLGNDLTGQVLGSGGTVLTLTPGVYCFSSRAQLTGDLILNGAGVYIFQVGTQLTTASASSITLTNGASACGVWWQVGSTAVLGTTTSLAGNVLALTSINVNTGASVTESSGAERYRDAGQQRHHVVQRRSGPSRAAAGRELRSDTLALSPRSLRQRPRCRRLPRASPEALA